MSSISSNNFDLIRLFAAAQVALKHLATHLDWMSDEVKVIIDIFPGVPIFFFVSGFLIYRSFENTIGKPDGIKRFFFNRAVRLYPALIVCFGFSLLIVAYSGYFKTQLFTLTEFLVWCFTSLSFMQFYNPPFLREFGVGALNGSLWSVSVEIQFYLLTPIAYYLFKNNLRLMLICILIFVGFNLFRTHYLDNTSMGEKLYSASFLPWFYMFLFGAYISKRSDFISVVKKIGFAPLLLGHALVWWLSVKFNLGWDNSLNPLALLILAMLIIKCAYSCPNLSGRLLKSNDISYGIYIYHMPIANFLIYHQLVGAQGFLVALIATIVMGSLSWKYIEKPMLNLKKVTLRRY